MPECIGKTVSDVTRLTQITTRNISSHTPQESHLAQERETLTMPKPFAPKPWAVGSVVDYEDRSGTVWSPGPVAASVWVQEADGLLVAVKRPTKTRPARILDGKLAPHKVRSRLRRAEAIRQGVAVRSTTERASSDFRGMPRTSSWSVDVVHASAQCAEVDPQGAVVPGYHLGRVALRVLQDAPPSTGATVPRLCPCIPAT